MAEMNRVEDVRYTLELSEEEYEALAAVLESVEAEDYDEEYREAIEELKEQI